MIAARCLRWLAAGALAVFVVLSPSTAHAELPAFEIVRSQHQPSDRLLLDRHGQPLQVLRLDASVRRGEWVALDDVSPALRQAIVLSEDRRFWAHAGIDWRALAASAWANAWNERTRGASTLTMQLAGLLHEDLARPAGGRSLGSKITQAWVAQRLEARWRKTQILEAYLNLVPLRGELVGVGAAAWQLFGKHPAGLDAEEAALLAVLVRGPNVAPALVERRACALLREQALGCDALAIVWSQALARRPGPAAGEQLAPHFARWWLARQPPPSPSAQGAVQPWRSTVDAALQRVARQALRQQLAELKGRNVEDGAVLVLDRASGEVLAWVGSAGSGSAAPAVDAVLARRQGGSTLKPLVYGAALQQRLLTAASVLDDSPLQIATGGALYRPRNYDEGFQGPVTLRRALAGSLNIPAVRVAQMLGPEDVFATFQRAGLQPSESAGYHGHALALGAADLRLLDLTEAYRRMATGQLFGPQLGWLLGDMLADPAARAGTFGLDSPLVTRGWAAVKTGTSKDMRDNWCVGYSDRFVVGVWVGNASGAPMHAVSGTEGAAPVWRDVLGWLHRAQPSRATAPPPGLVQQGGEWFLPGTLPRAEPPQPGRLPAAGSSQPATWHSAPFGIRQPRDGAVFALDPDIPPAAQQLVLEGAAGRWLVNGREVGRGARVAWRPRPGRHLLERHDSASGRIDRIRFEVRPGALGPADPGPGARATALP